MRRPERSSPSRHFRTFAGDDARARLDHSSLAVDPEYRRSPRTRRFDGYGLFFCKGAILKYETQTRKPSGAACLNAQLTLDLAPDNFRVGRTLCAYPCSGCGRRRAAVRSGCIWEGKTCLIFNAENSSFKEVRFSPEWRVSMPRAGPRFSDAAGRGSHSMARSADGKSRSGRDPDPACLGGSG